MRIALINKDFDASRGGGELYAINLAQGLVARGHDVTLVGRSVALPGADRMGFIRVEPAPSSNARRVESFCRAVDAVLHRDEFDLVHGLTQVYPQDIHRNGGGVFRQWELYSLPNPLVRAVVRLSPRNRVQRALEARIYDPANVLWVQTNSELVKGHVIRHYGLPPERIEAIHNGVDLEAFHPRNAPAGLAVRTALGIAPDAPVVLFVGNNIRRKGLAFLARALATVPGATGIHLVVVGHEERRKIDRALAAHPGPKHWVGGQADVAPYYAAADVFVMPTLYDPFANVTLEALASGVPVVTTRHNGAHEILDDSACAGVVETPRDVGGLAREIDRLLASRSADQRVRARAIALRYPWSRNLDAVVRLYERVFAFKQGGRQ